MGEPCGEKCGCFLRKFTEESRQNLFAAYWEMGDKVQQDQYLMGCLHRRPVKRRRTTDPNKPSKTQWFYKVGAEEIEVCRHTFMALFGIKPGKLRHVVELKEKSPENIAHPDMRGKSKFGLIIMCNNL